MLHGFTGTGRELCSRVFRVLENRANAARKN